MKSIIGIILIVAGISCGLYFGIWWAFIGGIMDVINEVRAEDLSAAGVAIGVAKVVFAGLIGYGCGAILVLPGIYALKD